MKPIIILQLCCITSLAYSQDRFTIEGIVKDYEGIPIPYVTVHAKSTSKGICTGIDGKFKIGGIKMGDILEFTSVGCHSSYFIVDRKYNVLNFKLRRDTMYTSIREYSKTSSFNFNHYPFESDKLEGYETSAPVSEIKNFDEKYIFTKVEISATYNSGYPKFIDSLASDINKLKVKYKPKKYVEIVVYTWIRSDKKIEVNTILGNIKDEVKQAIKKRFESIADIFPALQNGRYVNVLSVAKFQLDIDINRNVSLKLVN